MLLNTSLIALILLTTAFMILSGGIVMDDMRQHMPERAANMLGVRVKNRLQDTQSVMESSRLKLLLHNGRAFHPKHPGTKITTSLIPPRTLTISSHLAPQISLNSALSAPNLPPTPPLDQSTNAVSPSRSATSVRPFRPAAWQRLPLCRRANTGARQW